VRLRRSCKNGIKRQWLDKHGFQDALELVADLEKHFGVKVPNSDAAKQALASVNALHDYLVANRGSICLGLLGVAVVGI
jgi:hypothetical protein